MCSSLACQKEEVHQQEGCGHISPGAPQSARPHAGKRGCSQTCPYAQ